MMNPQSVVPEFLVRIKELRTEMHSEIKIVNDQIDNVNNRIDGLYNVLATQSKLAIGTTAI